MTLRFSLLGLIGFTTFAALASAALVQPGVGWTSVVVTLTAAMLVWQVLRLLLNRGESRAAAAGWLLFALGYLAVAVGPRVSSQLGPQLLSSKLLVYAQVQWHKVEPSNIPLLHSIDFNGRVNINTIPPNALIYDASSTIWTDPGLGIYALLGAGPVDPTASALCFQLTGHWLFAWLAGWLGAMLAVQFRRRRMRESA